MKRILTGICAAVAIVCSAEAQSVSLTNTFGGDTDNLSGKDFVVADKDGKKEDFHESDRLQLDVSSDNLDARIRADLNASGDKDGKNTTVQTRGYVNVRPVQYLNLIAGNKFFSKWAAKEAYLPAEDDYECYGKLADDNGAGVILNANGFKAAGAVGSGADKDINFGAEYNGFKMLGFAATAQNVTEKARSLSGYVGFTGVENLFIGAGYIHNHQSGYLPSTEHALQVTASYKFDSGLFVAADFLTGLNGKAYAAATEDFQKVNKDDAVPMFLAAKVSYPVLEDVKAAAKVEVKKTPAADKTTLSTVLYPNVEYKTSVGTFIAGARFYYDDQDGYKGFSIPFCWKYKISR